MYKLICYLIYFSGLPWLVRKLISHAKVTIVLYHDPSPETFERHIGDFKKTYTFIPLTRLIESIENRKPIPEKYPLVVTFDDGHKGNFDLLDHFQKHKIRPTIYICSSIVATNRRFWFKLKGLRSTQLKGLPHNARLAYLKENYDFTPDRDFGDRKREALSLMEIEKMKQTVDFQSHTRFHPILTTCSEDESLTEIRDSRIELETLTQMPVAHFAYPNGDYSGREIECLKANGFASARSTDIGWNDHLSNPYLLKVTGVNDHADLIMLKAELSGLPGYFYNIFMGGVNGKTLSGKHLPEVERK